MPSVGTAHTARCALIYSYPDSTNTFENTFYVRDIADAIFADIPLLAGEIATAAVAHVLSNLPSNLHLVATNVEDVRTVPFGGYEYTLSPPAAGTGFGGGGLPSNTALAIKKSSGSLGRSGRGRWFHPVLYGGQLDSPDLVTAAAGAAIVSHLADFQTAVEALSSGLEMGFVSYRTGGVARSAGLFQPITLWSYTDLALDCQRRRLLGK